MTSETGEEALAAVTTLRPNPKVLIGGSLAIALLSVAFLPWPLALASTTLGAFMLAGAEIDARTFLLPDLITAGAFLSGLVAAAIFDPVSAWLGLATATARAGGTALVLWLVRAGYARLRGREGLGLGDIKLALALGAWLPLQAIPLCFALATAAALIAVLLAALRGQRVERTTRVPLGTFLCPAVWLTYFASVLTG
ncbi:MAG TPA: A24 family peptidase [Xanthobacteraceae bacterium]|nr:A24 family peptidase [Xanthobacteraceae bacterium]